MKHCTKCNVDVESNLKNCPLCGAYLENDEGNKCKNIHAYREDCRTSRSKRILLKILLFTSIMAGIICLIVDTAIDNKLTWSLHLLVALVGTWIVLLMPIFAHIPLRKQIVVDMIVAIAIIFYTEIYAKNNNWAFHIGLPIVCMSGIGVFVLSLIIDHRRWKSYAMTATPVCIVSIIPIFISLGVFHTVSVLWYVTVGVAVMTLLSFFIFGRQGYFGEMKKRLHF